MRIFRRIVLFALTVIYEVFLVLLRLKNVVTWFDNLPADSAKKEAVSYVSKNMEAASIIYGGF